MNKIKALILTIVAHSTVGCAKTAKVSTAETNSLAYKQFVYAEENSDHSLNNIRYIDFDQSMSASKSVALNITSIHNAGAGNVFVT